VSVVVPLAGAPEQALRCFEGIAAQPDEPEFEVIVVDDASVGLEGLLGRLGGDVEVVRADRRRGFAVACQLGAAKARGEIVVFVRGAAVPQQNWLAPLVQALEDERVGAAASVTASDPKAGRVTTLSVAVRKAELCHLVDVEETFTFPTLMLGIAEHGGRIEHVHASRVEAPGTRMGSARRAPGESPELTIVIPTLDAASERVRACLVAIQASTDVAHEIVIVDNGSPPQGFSRPVNAGIRAADTPYVVVMNDDVEPLAGWWQPLRSTIDAGAAVAFPLTLEGPMRRDFAAWCFAIGRRAVRAFGHDPDNFFDPALVIWFQDTDLLHRLRKAGRPPVLVETSHIRHGLSESVASEDPVLRAWIKEQVIADERAFRAKHPDVELKRAA
jgi:GT2 family glycosyltransferase